MAGSSFWHSGWVSLFIVIDVVSDFCKSPDATRICRRCGLSCTRSPRMSSGSSSCSAASTGRWRCEPHRLPMALAEWLIEKPHLRSAAISVARRISPGVASTHLVRFQADLCFESNCIQNQDGTTILGFVVTSCNPFRTSHEAVVTALQAIVQEDLVESNRRYARLGLDHWSPQTKPKFSRGKGRGFLVTEGQDFLLGVCYVWLVLSSATCHSPHLRLIWASQLAGLHWPWHVLASDLAWWRIELSRVAKPVGRCTLRKIEKDHLLASEGRGCVLPFSIMADVQFATPRLEASGHRQ